MDVCIYTQTAEMRSLSRETNESTLAELRSMMAGLVCYPTRRQMLIPSSGEDLRH
jgi:hypothetical protein